jgi:hypothetical protein
MSIASARVLQDEKTGIRLKMAALWAATLFLFAYGDVFGLFRTGEIEDIVRGELSGIEITQVFLLAVSIYVAIASVMVFLSLALPPTLIRWTNMVLPVLYIASIVASVVGETWAYFYFLSVVEIALLALIIWYAWTWPGREPATTD